MKKILLITIGLLFLPGCSGKYEGWKEVGIQDYGSITVPEGWECHIRDHEIYFVDEGETEFSEGNVHLGGYIDDADHSHTPSKVFPKIEKVESVKGQVYSNSAYRGIKKYCIRGDWYEKGHIEIHASNRDAEIYMVAWDDTVSYDDLEKIAKSFTEK